MTNARLAGIAFVAGAAVMVIELMAVRLLAPWFGQSQIVWTHVIGVVLAAVAVGQWLGGRWAEAQRGAGPAWLLLLAGAWALAMPDAVRVLGAAVVPEALPLLEAYPFVTWGSLLVAVLTLGVPLLALGALTPWLVRLSRGAAEAPGMIAGRVLAAGTAGSLLGTFGATHLLLPWLGSAGAVQVAGGLLALLGLLVGRWHRRATPLGLPLLLLPVLLDRLPGRESVDGRVLERIESPHQLIRVVEADDGTRLLRLNEGLDSFHSLYRPGGFWSGTYFDAFLIPGLWAPPSADGRRDVLVLGLAAGTMGRQLLEVDPSCRVRGVEIDEQVIAVGRRWFALPPEVDVVAGADARVALAADPHRYGAILIDAYAQQIYLPAHLCTREFFGLVRSHLLPGGVAALNIGGTSREDPVVHAVGGTFAEVFPGARMARIPGTRNMLVLGFLGAAPSAPALAARLAPLPFPSVQIGATGIAWAWESDLLAGIDPAGEASLRDGWDPVESLAHASWAGERVVPTPQGAPAPDPSLTDLDRARRCMAWTDWTAALAALSRPLQSELAAERAQAQLLAGNIAYERGDFDAAIASYEACSSSSIGSDASAGLVETARENQAMASERRAEHAALAREGARLRLLALAACALAATLVGWVRWRR